VQKAKFQKECEKKKEMKSIMSHMQVNGGGRKTAFVAGKGGGEE